MSTEDEGGPDHWAVFQDELERAQHALERARKRYRSLNDLYVSVPDSFASALGEVEADIDAVNDVLDVSETDAMDARAVADRADLLFEALDASWEFRTALVDLQLDICDLWAEHLDTVASGDAASVSEDIGSLREFTANDNYGQLYGGERYSIASVFARLQQIDRDARESLPSGEYVDYCLRAVDEFEDAYLDDVRELVRADADIQIKEDRTMITNRSDQLRSALDDDALDEAAPATANVTLHGAMMLKFQTGYTRHGYEYRSRMLETVDRIDDVDAEIVDAVNDCDVQELLATVQAVIIDETTKSIEERVVAVLQEHDGSLRRALKATSIGSEEFFDGLETEFLDGKIADIEVQFE